MNRDRCKTTQKHYLKMKTFNNIFAADFAFEAEEDFLGRPSTVKS
jgi:hypothetical protein